MNKEALLAFAEVATPAGSFLPAADERLLAELQPIMRDLYGPSGHKLVARLLDAVDLAAVPLTGRRLRKLPLERRAQVLQRLHHSPVMHWPVRALAAPLKAALTSRPEYRRGIGMAPPSLGVAEPPPRWAQQILDARELDSDEELEVDAVIVGSGAGGAPMANALAAAGHAVLVIEEGSHFTRKDFDGRALRAQRRMFHKGGLQTTFGNTVIPLPTGKTVGGTTTINSGTCYRIPDSVHRRWMLENGLDQLGPGSLDSYYEKVEAMLQVERATPETLGGCARVIARGAEALGLEHGPLMRNAPGCDGQGLCCFGCPTDAKRSTNVSYLPSALQRGAMVMSNARVQRILTEGGRACGVHAIATGPSGSPRHIRVRASVVVLAAGALGTPTLLLQNGLANRSGQVGNELSIHPASFAWARFDEEIRGWEGIPQGYAIEEFAGQGLRFEGAFLPPEMAAASLSQVGKSWTELVENFHQLACFGFMVTDRSRGQVRLDRHGRPAIRYRLGREDVQQMIRGHAILARVYLAAGAHAVYPGVAEPWATLRSEEDVRRFEREAPSSLQARHISVTAFHPLGSCRMHSDPLRGVVSQSGETHQVPNLFVCDGSAVPGPLGVNPQMTIMALSERSASYVHDRIEEATRRSTAASELPPSPSTGASLRFAEVMAGQMDGPGTESVDVEFEVRASLPLEGANPWRERGATFGLEGLVRYPGVAEAAPCEGILRMRPGRRRGTLHYELDFQSDEGKSLRLVGDKNVSPLSTVKGMTTLYTELLDGDVCLAKGILYFDLKDLLPWLGTWSYDN